MKWDQTLIDDQLVKVLSATIPCSVFPLMEKMMLDALENHQHSLDGKPHLRITVVLDELLGQF